MSYRISATQINGDSVVVIRATLRDALRKAREFYAFGLEKTKIADHRGNVIEGEKLEACCCGEKTLTDDLSAE